jgi:hypothetical protein
VKVDERLIQLLAARLKKSVRDTRNIEISQIQIIGLEAIKQSVGAMWPQLASRVRETSFDFISRRIEAHDIVIPVGDGFLVVYAKAEGAEDRSRALQGELDSFYLGDAETRGLSARVEHRSLDAALLIERLAEPAGPLKFDIAPPTDARNLPLKTFPAWSVAQGAITNYWITPEHSTLNLGRYSYDPIWTATGVNGHDSDFLELDLKILDQAVNGILSCLQRDRRCVVGFSVHSTTMINRNRRTLFLQALARTPQQVRPYLLGRIAEVQPGTPTSTLGDWVHHLRAVSQRIAIQIHPTHRHLAGFGAMGLKSVACVMPQARPTASEATAFAKLIPGWSRDLRRQGIMLRLDNLNNPQLLDLVTGHVDFCSSPRLWSPVALPEGVKPFAQGQFLDAIPLTRTNKRAARPNRSAAAQSAVKAAS